MKNLRVNPDYETYTVEFRFRLFGVSMVDIYKAIGMDFSPNLFIKDSYVNLDADNDDKTFIDSDSVLNPGESGDLYVNLENEIGWVNATGVNAVLNAENNMVNIITSEHHLEILKMEVSLLLILVFL